MYSVNLITLNAWELHVDILCMFHTKTYKGTKLFAFYKVLKMTITHGGATVAKNKSNKSILFSILALNTNGHKSSLNKFNI